MNVFPNHHCIRCQILLMLIFSVIVCAGGDTIATSATRMSRREFSDKMKGAWCGQLIGVTYGFPAEFVYNSACMPDSIPLAWKAGMLKNTYTTHPGAYDDIYVDLTFLEVYRKNKNAFAIDYARAFGATTYWLWFANQMARNNIKNGIMPKQSGHWVSNPECTSIDFQIESDFIGLLHPGLQLQALALADSVGHIMAYGDGYYGGIFVSQMYAAAFMTSRIDAIIAAGLASIPKESLFHRMISDVVEYHRTHSRDWKANWRFINRKYANENGSPFAVFDQWNIEASMNAAHVVTGLLYGDGDFTRSMEIAVRCGDDADCNPAICGGILGTIRGFSKIPATYTREISSVMDVKFQQSDYSLKNAIDVTERLALENIANNGGRVTETDVVLVGSRAPLCALEVARPDRFPTERVNLWKKIALADSAAIQYLATLNDVRREEVKKKSDSVTIAVDLFSTELNFTFRGNGFCTFGKVVNEQAGEWNFTDDSTSASVYIDGVFSQNVIFPIDFNNRRFLAFFDYTLAQGEHSVRLVANTARIKNYRFEMYHSIYYSNENPDEITGRSNMVK